MPCGDSPVPQRSCQNCGGSGVTLVVNHASSVTFEARSCQFFGQPQRLGKSNCFLVLAAVVTVVLQR